MLSGHRTGSGDATIAATRVSRRDTRLTFNRAVQPQSQGLGKIMIAPIRVLLQTTIPESNDDWSIDRFSLLRGHLASLIDGNDNALAEVTARNREADGNGDDPVLRVLDRSAYDELWLFATDAGRGLTAADCAGITRFRQRGGGILLTRDHQDPRSSLCYMGGIGAAHLFYSRNPEPDAARPVVA